MATAIGLGGTDAQERGERGEQRESPGVVRAPGGAAERATARLLSLPGVRGPRASFLSPMRDAPPEAAPHVGGAGASCDRKSVVSGKRVSARVDHVGRRLIKKKRNE